jgi:hypothetical protein
MKKTGIILISFGILWCACLTVQADPGADYNFYKSCLEQKIAQCQRKARLVHSRGDHLKAYGEKSREKAVFYQENKERLVESMVDQGIPKKQYKIDYVLLHTYHNEAYNGKKPLVPGGTELP